MLVPFKGNLCSREAEKMLSIKITDKCNMLCAFCIDRGGRNCHITDIDKIAEKAISFKDYRKVIITGGEPFLVFRDVINLLNLLRPHKDEIVLNTNGSLVTKEFVEELNNAGLDELQVSIHHYNEFINNFVYNGCSKEMYPTIRFNTLYNTLKCRNFRLSINSTFNNSYTIEERPGAIEEMKHLCMYLKADKLRLTELKKVGDDQFVPASDFLPKDDLFTNRSDDDLITKGCTMYAVTSFGGCHNLLDNDLVTKGCTRYIEDSKYRMLTVSIKRLCKYAKGVSAPAFSCCFINSDGQKKIDVDTVDTFKVIYSDGYVSNDWIFNPKKECD